jgi:choline dehydrogenase
MRWDTIIVGAGSAGCAVAHELIRAGQTVLIIEAGGSDRSPWLRIPLGVWRIGAHYDWGYRSQPDPTRNGAVEAWHRGRVLGGTSSINGMVYVRGAAGDFDRWAERCGPNTGWSATDVMPMFRDFESSDQRSPLRGRCGPLHVRTIKHPHTMTDAFIESVCNAGYPFNADYNGATQDGVSYLQLTQRRGLRWSAADAFLRPLQHRKNVQVRLHAVVEKIEFSAGKATGVVFRHRGTTFRETAPNIVLSAGAINTPKLLMLSGIGNPDELRRHNIKVALELPAVGSHLREHAFLPLTYRSAVPTYNLTQGMRQKLAIAATYLRSQEGPIAAAYEAAVFLRTLSSISIPDIQVFFAPIGWERTGERFRLTSYPAVKVCIVRSHSISSGRISLASSNPLDAPLIECRLLESEGDVETLARGVEVIRAIMRTKPIARLIKDEIAPGESISNTQALHEYIRNNTTTACHPFGTCRMGVGPDTVVDPQLRVHGTDNLWIADASIMPDGISANLNAPCMMIGAKLGKQLAVRT